MKTPPFHGGGANLNPAGDAIYFLSVKSPLPGTARNNH